jgi:cell division protein FtsW
MSRRIDFDIYILFAALTLVGVGIVMICSSSYILAQEKFGDGLFFLKKEVFFALIGVMLMILAMNLNYQVYYKTAYLILFFGIVLLFLPWVPGLGREVSGSTRWIRFLGFSFQPSEFTKLALIVFLSSVLAKKKDKIKVFSSGFLPLVLVAGIVMTLIIGEPDFGTAAILGTVVFILLFTAGAKLRHLFILFLGILPFIYLLIAHTSYRLERITSFLNPWEDPTGSGFQIIQSFIAFGAGGIFGMGLGEGRQKLYFLPEPHTDFIFSIIGEELGLIGVTIILIIFLFFIYRGFRISLKAPDLFGTFLALGIISLIGLRAMVNIGVSMGLLPTKGLPLPFISYGGTALVMNLIEVGILLNISSQGKRQ